MAHSLDEKIEFILKAQFRNLSMQTLAIFQIMSVCNSKKIPEYLIQELFNSYFPEDDLLNYKNSLVNQYIITVEGEFWNLHTIVHDYIKNNYLLKEKENVIYYYYREFIIKKNIKKEYMLHIMHLRPHLESLVRYLRITTIEEWHIFNQLIHFYQKNQELQSLGDLMYHFLFESDGSKIVKLSSTIKPESESVSNCVNNLYDDGNAIEYTKAQSILITFCSAIMNLKMNDQIDMNKPKTTNHLNIVSQNLIKVKRFFESLKSKPLLLKINLLLKEYIHSNDLEGGLEETLTNFLGVSSSWSTNKFLQLCTDIDEFIIDPIQKTAIDECRDSNLIFTIVSQNIDKLYLKHQDTYNDYEQRYMTLAINSSKPCLQQLYFLAIVKLLTYLRYKDCLSELIYQVGSSLINHQVYISDKFLILMLLPQKIQYIYVEMILTIDDSTKYRYIIKFIYETVPKGLDYMKFQWKDKFIQTALQSPYAETLAHFKNSDLSLEALLHEITENIYLVTMPQKIFGITLKTRSISIKYFEGSTGSQGASFVIYLHELAHFLRRANCTTISDAFLRKSQEAGENEGGYHLEEILFGKIVEEITSGGRDFILCENLQEKINMYREDIRENPLAQQEASNVKLFQMLFAANNKHYPGVDSISLCRMGGAIYLGECGSFYGSIKWKPI